MNNEGPFLKVMGGKEQCPPMLGYRYQMIKLTQTQTQIQTSIYLTIWLHIYYITNSVVHNIKKLLVRETSTKTMTCRYEVHPDMSICDPCGLCFVLAWGWRS